MFKRMPPSPDSGRRIRSVRPAASSQKVPVLQPGNLVPIRQVKNHIKHFLSDQGNKGSTPRTIGNYEDVLGKLLWWLERSEVEGLGADELRDFFDYLRTAHELPEGRWGEAGETRDSHKGKVGYSIRARYSPVSVGTLATYHRRLSCFGNYLVDQEALVKNPMAKISKPKVRDNPLAMPVYNEDQLLALFAEAAKTPFARRDRAIFALFLDTGLRVSELCSLDVGDLDMGRRCAMVVGKGEKKREVFWQGDTNKFILRYLQSREWEGDPNEPLFIGERGLRTGERMTRGGMLKMIKRVAEKAEIYDAFCHKWRHTYATMMLKNGCDQLSLMRLLGHEDVTMTNRYVHLAGSDVAEKAAQFSPMKAILRSKRRR